MARVVAMVAAAPAMVVVVVFLGLVLDKVFGQAAQDAAANGAEEAMALLLAELVARKGATCSAEEAALTLGHRGCIRVVVGRVGVAGLRRVLLMLVVRARLGRVAALRVWRVSPVWIRRVSAGGAACHPGLIGLVFEVRVPARDVRWASAVHLSPSVINP